MAVSLHEGSELEKLIGANAEIARLRAALAAARNRIDDDTETINRQLAELVMLRTKLAEQPAT